MNNYLKYYEFKIMSSLRLPNILRSLFLLYGSSFLLKTNILKTAQHNSFLTVLTQGHIDGTV